MRIKKKFLLIHETYNYCFFISGYAYPMILTKTRTRIRAFLQKRYDTSGKSDVEQYYGEQMAYGHREVLLDFLGASRDLFFKASLTHGKILPDNLDPIRPLFRKDGSQILQGLWRSDAEVEATKKGVEALSIGATGLYALQNLGQSIAETKKSVLAFAKNHLWSENYEDTLNILDGRKVLYMPLHSWDGDVVNHESSDVGVLKSLNPKKVTVLLAYLDFLDLENRRYYESFGFKVECAGIRASKVFGSPAGGREKFLYSLFDIISGADVVVSNALTTGLLYATCLNKQVGFLPNVGQQKLKFSHWRSSEDFTLDMNNQNKFFPWLTDTAKSDKQAVYGDISDALGLDQFKSPTKLASLIPTIRIEH